jgi:hypothetical protein
MMNHLHRIVPLQIEHYTEKNSTTLQNSSKKMKMTQMVSDYWMSMSWEENSSIWETMGVSSDFFCLEAEDMSNRELNV